jgi:hypothetical protein
MNAFTSRRGDSLKADYPNIPDDRTSRSTSLEKQVILQQDKEKISRGPIRTLPGWNCSTHVYGLGRRSVENHFEFNQRKDGLP